MTTTTIAERQAFDADHYLDCRRPAWAVYEDRGLVRYERLMGSQHALVFIDADCAEVLQTLRLPLDWSVAARR